MNIDTRNMTASQILDLADRHDEKLRLAIRDRDDKSAARHEDIIDALVMRAYRAARS